MSDSHQGSSQGKPRQREFVITVAELRDGHGVLRVRHHTAIPMSELPVALKAAAVARIEFAFVDRHGRRPDEEEFYQRLDALEESGRCRCSDPVLDHIAAIRDDPPLLTREMLDALEEDDEEEEWPAARAVRF